MSHWERATWKKDGEQVTGSWSYDWAKDCFHILLDEPDPVTGNRITDIVYGDHPDFNGWKLVTGGKQ